MNKGIETDSRAKIGAVSEAPSRRVQLGASLADRAARYGALASTATRGCQKLAGSVVARTAAV
jgi:hypothetical protein